MHEGTRFEFATDRGNKDTFQLGSSLGFRCRGNFNCFSTFFAPERGIPLNRACISTEKGHCQRVKYLGITSRLSVSLFLPYTSFNPGCWSSTPFAFPLHQLFRIISLLDICCRTSVALSNTRQYSPSSPSDNQRASVYSPTATPKP